MKNKCELCKSRARIYCDSDQASLCWTCDAKVHAANFIVARHPRTLLCHSCNSLTHWTASGSLLGRAFCVCHSCISTTRQYNNMHESQEDEDDEDERNNLVVPLNSTLSAPPPSSSSTNNDENMNEDVCSRVHKKRMCRNVSDLGSQCETRQTYEGEDSVTGTRKKSLKRQRRIRCSDEEERRSGGVDLNHI